MRNVCATAIAGLLLGCTPKAPSQPPKDEAQAAPTVAEGPVAEAPPEPAVEAVASEPEVPKPADAEDAGTTLASSEEVEPADTPGGEVTDDGGTTPAPEPAKPSKPATAKFELPRPLHSDLDAACGKDPGVGERLKSFSLPGIEGTEPVTTGTYRGRVLVVNFWGTWCKPCLKELPEFDQLYRRYRKHGMTLLAIATDEDAKAVKDIVAEKKLGAKVAIAGEAYAGQYGSAKFPFTFVVDHKGVIQASYRGYKPECMGQLEADIRSQLEVRADAKAQRKKG